MREIKFRVWSRELNKIVYPDDRGWFDKCFIGKNGYYQTCSLDIVLKKNGTKLDVMQYTGLKDKNGTPIYEGDILKGEYTHIKKKWPEYNDEVEYTSKPEFEVIFTKGGFCIRQIYKDNEFFPVSILGLTEFTWFLTPLSNGQTHEYSKYESEMGLRNVHLLTNLEVIGNKFEDGDLLEKANS